MSQSAAPISSSEWLVLALVASVFAPAVFALAGVWSSVDYYSHGFLVPVVAYWAARRGAERVAIASSRDLRGIALGGLAVAVYAVGIGVDSVTLQGLALIGAVCAVVLYLGGAAALRALAFPLAFLIFMVPAPSSWLTPLIVQLQLIVSSAAVGLLEALGSAVYRSGNVIELPGGDALFVAEACSGITSIVTLIPLAVVLAYFTERTLARRLVIVAAVIPAAMFGNLLRVFLTVVAAERYGSARATGNLLHESAGMLTFALACGLLIGLGELMRRFAPARQ